MAELGRLHGRRAAKPAWRGPAGELRAAFRKARGRLDAGRAARIWELDALRGILVIMMAVYHAYYSADFLGFGGPDPHSGFLGFIPIPIAAGFLLVSGMSLRIMYQRLRAKGHPRPLRPFLRRFLAIAIPALLVSLATLPAVGFESFVAFGILHCIALAGLLAYPLIGRPWAALFAGTAAALIGFAILKERAFDPAWSRWILWLGFRPSDYYPIDYVPLLPWAGFCLIGTAAGALAFSEGGDRRYPMPLTGRSPLSRALCFLGRHSLLIYIVHVPIILGILLAIKALLGA
jgi:uncharacterized membrane protein